MKKSGICAIVKNEEKYILEWIAHNIIIGFDSIVIYDNESEIDVSNIISTLSHDIHIDVIKWPSIEGVSPQLSAYNDYISRYSNHIEYTAFIDLDEFIFIKNDMKINDFLNSFSEDASAISLNQLCFGSSGHEVYARDLVTRRFNHTSPLSFEENNYFKTIAKTKHIENIIDCHWVVLNEGNYINSEGQPLLREHDHKGKANNPSHQNIILHHYILKSKEEFAMKRNRGGGISSTLSGRLSKYDESAFSSRDSAYQTKHNSSNEHEEKLVIFMKQIARSEESKLIFSQYYNFLGS
ncbi:glycosyltransferase family 92 protein [Escherichia coli]|uniref:glycosyltransferase family 92 protein n=1 Tax=Escherichia coli TaxID=562 RepID=UPI0037BFE672